MLGALSLAGCPKRAGPEKPAVVVIAMRIRTGDPKLPVVQAMALRDGKILKLGSRAEVLAAAGEGAIIDEFPSGVIVPGLVDAHGHLLGLGEALALVGLWESTDENDAVKRLKAAGPDSKQGEWVLGRGWDQNKWPRGELPSRWALDAELERTPVFATRVDGHAAWVSGEALKRARITKDTKDPPGGRIVRDKVGEPTGVLIDNAMELVRSKIPPPSDEQLKLRLKAAVETCARVGLTGVHDAGLSMAVFELLQRWDVGGALPIRVYAMANGQGDDRDLFLGRGPYQGRHLSMRAVKLLADGALGSRGAALFQPYSDAPGETGLMLLKRELLQQRAEAFSNAGFQVAIHAIGDKANAETFELLEKLPKTGRHRIEHAQVLREEDVGRFAKSGIIASVQPTHATSDMGWAEARLGAARAKYAYAFKSLLDTKANVAFGSDFPVERPDPLLGLFAARTRTDASGQPAGGWHPEQKLTPEEALAGFTSGAAYAEFAEDRRGVLREGYDADFVALSVDPVEDPPEALLGAKVLVTVVDGIDVWRDPSVRQP
ncbi:MAG: amidohydrolase [Myxococcaceae bacterium]|nr:amidohydrolase [Myxococcaceae bacterium]